ncbi:30S ribosomal protein S5 [Rubrobacter radiotolerans]|nr:30S ribosomal protein S5 [Rubrobacter radiotolerans]MDX5894612.1 30S ribosomal protein S5 [Rubrobacter radiotolerans]
MDSRGGARGGGGTSVGRDSGGPPRGGRGRARDNRGRGRERDEFQDRVVEIRRVATVKKGGRRLNFSALVVVGDGNGRVGVGLGKANTVPAAIAKGQDRAKANMFQVPMRNTTIPHEVIGKYLSSDVLLKPASEGTGVIAGGGVRAVLELAGIKDILTKALGSTTPVNLVKATEQGLRSLRTKDQIEAARGVKIAL